MEVVSECPLTVGSVLWQSGPKAWTLTLVAKATFALSPSESPLAPNQDAVQAGDLHWDKDPSRSLALATDLVPFKRRPEVMVVGVAHAPGGKPVGSLVVRVAISSVDKSFEVRGDQHFTRDGKLSEPVKWKRMPLRWERAAGGADTSNPVGVPTGTEARFDSWGRCALPNLVPIGTMSVSPYDPIEPVGFAPIAPRWPSRLARLAGLVEGFDPSRWTSSPLPEHFDAAYFNAAPRDQQLSVLDGTESLLLENLHPRHPVLTTRLAPIRPLAAFEWGKGRSLDIGLTCDTLLVDADQGIATLVYRGHIALDHPGRTGRIVVTLEGSHDPRASVPGWIHHVDDVQATVAPSEDEIHATLPFRMSDDEEMPTMPKRLAGLIRPRTSTVQGTEAPKSPALPFRATGASAASATGTLLPFRAPQAADLPFRSPEDPDETITVQGAESPFSGRSPSEVAGLLAQHATDVTPIDPGAAVPSKAPIPFASKPLVPKAPPTFGLPPAAPAAPIAPIAPISPKPVRANLTPFAPASPGAPSGRITQAQAREAAARAPLPSVSEVAPFVPPRSVFQGAPPQRLLGALGSLPGTHEETVDGDALVEEIEASVLEAHDLAEEIEAEPDSEPDLATLVGGVTSPRVITAPPITAAPDAYAAASRSISAAPEAIVSSSRPISAASEAIVPSSRPSSRPPEGYAPPARSSSSAPTSIATAPAAIPMPARVPSQPPATIVAPPPVIATPPAYMAPAPVASSKAVTPPPIVAPVTPPIVAPVTPPIVAPVTPPPIVAPVTPPPIVAPVTPPPIVAPVTPPPIVAPPVYVAPSETARLPIDTHPIDRCARIAASLAVRPAERGEILRGHGLDERTWARLEEHWAYALYDEAERQKNALLRVHDAEYIAQIEAERGPIGVGEYARLVVASERGTTDVALAALRIPVEAQMRIRRVWIARIARDMDLGARVRRALADERDR